MELCYSQRTSSFRISGKRLDSGNLQHLGTAGTASPEWGAGRTEGTPRTGAVWVLSLHTPTRAAAPEAQLKGGPSGQSPPPSTGARSPPAPASPSLPVPLLERHAGGELLPPDFPTWLPPWHCCAGNEHNCFLQRRTEAMLQVTEVTWRGVQGCGGTQTLQAPTLVLLTAALGGCEHPLGSSEQDLAPNLSLKKGGGDKAGKKLRPCQQGCRDPLVSGGSGGGPCPPGHPCTYLSPTPREVKAGPGLVAACRGAVGGGGGCPQHNPAPSSSSRSAGSPAPSISQLKPNYGPSPAAAAASRRPLH